MKIFPLFFTLRSGKLAKFALFCVIKKICTYFSPLSTNIFQNIHLWKVDKLLNSTYFPISGHFQMLSSKKMPLVIDTYAFLILMVMFALSFFLPKLHFRVASPPSRTWMFSVNSKTDTISSAKLSSTTMALTKNDKNFVENQYKIINYQNPQDLSGNFRIEPSETSCSWLPRFFGIFR